MFKCPKCTIGVLTVNVEHISGFGGCPTCGDNEDEYAWSVMCANPSCETAMNGSGYDAEEAMHSILSYLLGEKTEMSGLEQAIGKAQKKDEV
jgi:hypothetical protein